jgi:hypothetical protein
MFGWFRRRAKTQPPALDAYQSGQSSAAQVVERLDVFVVRRFSGLPGGYLNVLRDSIKGALVRSDYSPLEIARVEYENFLAEVSDCGQKNASRD